MSGDEQLALLRAARPDSHVRSRYRYYDGTWYLMGLLHCSGEFPHLAAEIAHYLAQCWFRNRKNIITQTTDPK